MIAVLASYTALDLGERVTSGRGPVWMAWLISGAIAMGIGIWSMHYTGMLAYRLPVPVLFHWPTAMLSLLAGIASSVMALFGVSWNSVGWLAGLAGGIFQGRACKLVGCRKLALMKWTVKLVAEAQPGNVVEQEVITIEREDTINPATVGLTIAEGKAVMESLQR